MQISLNNALVRIKEELSKDRISLSEKITLKKIREMLNETKKIKNVGTVPQFNVARVRGGAKKK